MYTSACARSRSLWPVSASCQTGPVAPRVGTRPWVITATSDDDASKSTMSLRFSSNMRATISPAESMTTRYLAGFCMGRSLTGLRLLGPVLLVRAAGVRRLCRGRRRRHRDDALHLAAAPTHGRAAGLGDDIDGRESLPR